MVELRESKSCLDANLRTRVQALKGNGLWSEENISWKLPVEQTAILICDMWDKHWCRGAMERTETLAYKMNPVIEAARANGIQIIHSPSDTMDFYRDTPYRRRILDVPHVDLPEPINLPTPPPLPIDDSDGGCDTGETQKRRVRTRQHAAIVIAGHDVVSDSGPEIYRFIHHYGIKNLAIMGVHTNMCVLQRSFGIQQMTSWGMKCILVRDLTDSMYNPESPPFVSHDEGTQLVVEFIEKYWCPSIVSEDLLKVHPQ